MPVVCLLYALLTAVPVVPWSDLEAAVPLHAGGEGVQTGSTAALDGARSHSGKQAVKVHYRFVAKPPGRQYFGFGADLLIPMRVSRFAVWVLGDGSKLPVNLRLCDRSGETHQFNLGRLDFVGWRQMTCAITDGGLAWGGDQNRRLDPPLRLELLLVDSSGGPGESDVWFDDLIYQPEVVESPPWAESISLPAVLTVGGEQMRPEWRVARQDSSRCQVTYQFDDAGERQHLDLAIGARLPAAEALAVDVDSDGQGQVLRFQLLDAGGETHQVTWGPLLWRGRLRCEVPVTAGEHWGGDNNGKLDLPLKLQAIVIDRGRPASGTIGLANLAATPARGPASLRRVSLETCDGAAPSVGGDHVQPGSRIVADGSAKHEGHGSWRLDYDFAQIPGLQYLEVPLHRPLGPHPRPLRFWFRGDGTRQPLRLRCADSSGEVHQYNLGDASNTDWREVVCDFAVPHGQWGGDQNGKLDGLVTLQSLLLDASVRPSKGSVWFAQVTGEAVLRAADMVVPKLWMADDRWVRQAGKPVSFRLTWQDLRDGPDSPQLLTRAHVRAAGSREVSSLVDFAPTSPGGGFTVPNIARAAGLYEVTLIWRVEDDYGHQTATYAVLPDMPEVNLPTNPFGACLHFEQGKGKLPDTYDLLRLGGSRWSRDEYSWGVVERRRGEYTFPERNDTYLRAARQRGIEPLIILDYGNRLYDGGNSPASDEAQDAFAKYAYAMVSRYKDVCRHWEVYNEPNISFWKPKPDPVAYARLLKKTYAACKQADPDCVVVGICTAGTDLRYIEAVLKAGGGPFMDALSVHPYRYPRSPESSGFVAELQKCHDLMAQYGIGDKPIWITEIGWPNHQTAGGSSEEHTANCLVRMVALARSLPYLGPIIWYDFQDDGWDPSYNEANFGLIRPDFAPKRPYLAAAMMSRVLAGKRFARTMATEAPVYAQEYAGQGGERTLVLWSTPTEAEIAVTVDAPEVELSDVTGRVEPRLLKGGRLNLTLGEAPVFLTGQFTRATLLPAPLSVSAEPTWPGRQVALRCRLTNWADQARTAALTAVVPAGWTAAPVAAELPAGGQTTASLSVSVPAAAAPGDYEVTVQDGERRAVVTVTVQPSMVLSLVPQWRAGQWAVGAIVRNTTDAPLAGVRVAAEDAPPVAVPTLAAGAQAEIDTPAVPPRAQPAEVVPLRVTSEHGDERLAQVVRTNFWPCRRLPAVPVDGDLTEWSDVPAVALTDWQTPEGVAPKAAGDLSAQVRVAHTAAGLALAIEVRDDHHLAVDPPEDGWQGDGVQFAIDPLPDARGADEPYCEIGLTLGAKGPLAYRFTPEPKLLPAATVAIVRRGDQTVYEALVPWRALGLPAVPSSGRRLGFGALVNENDGTGRQGWLQVFSGIGWSKQPSELGVLVLTPGA